MESIANQASSGISEKLTKLSIARPDCTIYRVYKHLRNLNDKAYDPEIVAIGPYHRENENLKIFEEHKLDYIQLLFTRIQVDLQTVVSTIAPYEQEARKCYAEASTLSASEFIQMLVLDGCFIIELVRKSNRPDLRESNDPIFHLKWIMNSLQRDMILFENQIPFFILCKLFDLIECPGQQKRLIYLISQFFENLYPGTGTIGSSTRHPDTIKHLLDLMHDICCPRLLHLEEATKKIKKDQKRWPFINNATWLRDANVKFAKDDKTLLDISFKSGIMLLPQCTVEDRTESLFRNLIAYEQYFHHTQTSYMTDYVKFLDCLIDSSEDVGILSQYGIINNWRGDDKVVADMFNKLTDSVTGPGKHFIYAEIFESVNRHCNKRRNRWMAKLRKNYLHSPWVIISIFTAVLLLLLTFAQTATSILQVLNS